MQITVNGTMLWLLMEEYLPNNRAYLARYPDNSNRNNSRRNFSKYLPTYLMQSIGKYIEDANLIYIVSEKTTSYRRISHRHCDINAFILQYL